jgi:tetratricopeptide (TPR) repeat protein
VNAAYVHRFLGQEESARVITFKALPVLRSAYSENRSARLAQALALALQITAERAMENASPERAIAACREMTSLVEAGHPLDPWLRCSAQYWDNIANFFIPDNEDAAVSRMDGLLRSVLDAGRIAEACAITSVLADFHRILGRPRRALQMLLAIEEVVRVVCFGEPLGGWLLQTAEVYTAFGRVTEAYAQIAEARASVPERSFVFARSYLSEAEAALRADQPQRALIAAHRGIELFSSLGRPRLVGHALRFQALALEALGKQHAAMVAMTESLDRLEPYAHHSVVEQARREASRISSYRRALR